MAEIAFTDKWLTVWLGDVLDALRQMPAESVHMLVTSPPYWGLRDYGVPSQLGLEKLHDCLAWARGAELCGECHVCRIVTVFREARRVLRPDGTVWLNYGDSYHNGDKGGYAKNRVKAMDSMQRSNLAANFIGAPNRMPLPGLKPKDLVGIPWRVAFALQADGWWLRSDIIWHKPNSMPESVTDRPTKSHEYIFLLTKSERYFYDAEAVKEPAQLWPSGVGFGHGCDEIIKPRFKRGGTTAFRGAGTTSENESRHANRPGRDMSEVGSGTTRNARTVWKMPTQSFKGAHFATFPEELPRKCILAGTSEKGVCPDCGAPWVRVVEKSGGRNWHDDIIKYKGIPGERNGDAGNKRGQSTSSLNNTQQITTLGWRPSCSCRGRLLRKHSTYYDPIDKEKKKTTDIVYIPDPDKSQDVVPATVLDPFGGSGTTGQVANELGRRVVLIELNPEYVEMLKRRNAQGVLV